MNIKNYHDLLEWFSGIANYERKAVIELMTDIMKREELSKKLAEILNAIPMEEEE